jgi:hypothetical protein
VATRSSQLRWAHLSRWIGNSLSYSGNARPVKKFRKVYELQQQQLESTRFILSRTGSNFALLHLPPERPEDTVYSRLREGEKNQDLRKEKKEREKEKENKEERENIIV